MSVRKSLLPTGCKNIFFLKKWAKKSGIFFEQKVLIKKRQFFFRFSATFYYFCILIIVIGSFVFLRQKLFIKNIKYYGKN